MNRKQSGHRLHINDSIILVMHENSNKWMTANQISKIIGSSNTRGVGRRLNYLCNENPELECYTDKASHKRFFRYNTLDEWIKSLGMKVENENQKIEGELS